MDKTVSSSTNFRLQDYRQSEPKIFNLKQEKKVFDTNKSPEMNPHKKRKITIIPNNMDYESSKTLSNDSPKSSTSNKTAVNIVQKVRSSISHSYSKYL